MARRQANDASERKTSFVGFQVSPSERAELDARAVATGESLSEMCRRRMLAAQGSAPPSPRDAKAIRELCLALVRIGTNVNQMAYRANETRRVPEERYLRELGEKVQAALDRVTAL
jgi:hypothetical protein